MKTRRTVGKPQPGDEQRAKDRAEANRIVARELVSRQNDTKRTLDFLRSTRGTRPPAALEVPTHLRGGAPEIDRHTRERVGGR